MFSTIRRHVSPSGTYVDEKSLLPVYDDYDTFGNRQMPPKQNPWKIVIQFGLIILISACVAGIVGGVTSQIGKWKSSSSSSSKLVETTAEAIVNESATVVRMVAVPWHA